jgi:hypothetical protein
VCCVGVSGKALQDKERQHDLIQSDISYLKLDDSIKRNKLNSMQGIINDNKLLIEKQDAEVTPPFLFPCH